MASRKANRSKLMASRTQTTANYKPGFSKMQILYFQTFGPVRPN